MSQYLPLRQLGALALPLLALPFLPAGGIGDQIAMHTLLEIASIVCCLLCFSVGWSDYPLSRIPTVLYVACGLLGVALLDTAHTLSFPGMPDWLTANHDDKSIALWLCARLLAGLTLIGITHAHWHKTDQPGLRPRALAITLIGSAALAGVAMTATTTPAGLFFDHGLTAAKIACEYLIAALYAIALWRLLRRTEEAVPYERRKLALALAAAIIAELLFTAYGNAGDTICLLAHLYKVCAYYLLYQALFVGLFTEPMYRLARTERALRASEGNLVTLFESSPDGTLVLDAEGRVTRANSQCARLFGYSVRELNEHLLEDILPGCTFSRLLQSKLPGNMRFIARRRSGAEFAVEVAFAQVELDGRPHVMVTFHDVNVRDQLERQLEANEARLSSFLDNSVDWVWETDAAGCLVYSSRSVQQLLGFSSTEIIGRPFLSLFDSEERNRVALYWRECLERREPLLLVEKAMRHRNGSSVYLETSASPFFDAHGHYLGYRGIDREVGRRNQLRQALAESEERFRQLFEYSPIGIAITELDGRQIDCNPGLSAMLGISRDELLTLHPKALAHPTDFIASMPLREAVVNGLSPSAAFDIRYRHSSGQFLWARTTISLIRSPYGNRPCLLVQVQDTTATRQGQQRAERLFAIIDNTEVAISVIDRQLRLSYLNPAARRLLGVDNGTAPERLQLQLLHPAATVALLSERALPHAERTGNWAGETLWRASDGCEIPMWETIMAHRDESGEIEYWSSIARDLRETRQCEARLAFQDTHDALTALPNRALLRDRFQQALALARRNQSLLALILIDLDNFKRINDYLGHGAGDSVLLEVSHRLRQCLRETDTLARQGGDEFTVLLSDVASIQDIVTIADKLIENLQDAILIGQREVFVTASLGLSVYPYDQDNFDELLRKAEIAMYQAKESGRNTHLFYTSEMEQRYRADLEIENDLRRAIERDELQLHYQPKYRLDSGELVGFEALLRWLHPVHGMIPPGRFIPVAERSNLIVALGEWALATACRQVVQWQQQGLQPGRMAVNVSAQQFEYSDVTSSVTSALAESGLAPASLELEITEGVLMSDPATASRILENLKALGISIAIDDFGTGYSSLGYLKRFPVDVLKIDRSFVAEVTSNGDDAAIVRAIVSMAHALDISLVAEGIETEGQRRFLADCGCDTAQGFLFSRPLDRQQADSLLAQLHSEAPRQ